MEATVRNLNCDVPNAGCFRIASDNGHYTKAFKAQNYGTPGWYSLSGVKIKRQENSFLTGYSG
jgi:hypothetical protein